MNDSQLKLLELQLLDPNIRKNLRFPFDHVLSQSIIKQDHSVLDEFIPLFKNIIKNYQLYLKIKYEKKTENHNNTLLINVFNYKCSKLYRKYFDFLQAFQNISNKNTSNTNINIKSEIEKFEIKFSKGRKKLATNIIDINKRKYQLKENYIYLPIFNDLDEKKDLYDLDRWQRYEYRYFEKNPKNNKPLQKKFVLKNIRTMFDDNKLMKYHFNKIELSDKEILDLFLTSCKNNGNSFFLMQFIKKYFHPHSRIANLLYLRIKKHITYNYNDICKYRRLIYFPENFITSQAYDIVHNKFIDMNHLFKDAYNDEKYKHINPINKLNMPNFSTEI